MLHYRPQAILLPTDSRVTRRFHDSRQHLPGRAPLDESDYAGFETHTIFNDLFLHADGRAVAALGPPLVNLARHVEPIVLTAVDARGLRSRLPHRYRARDRVTMHRFALPPRLHHVDRLDVELRLGNGQEHTLALRRPGLSPVGLQFVTLQKDNPLDWIVDWLHYLRSIGVERVVLYDNGSQAADELQAGLARLESDLSIVFVEWPFPYGPVRSYYNQFCQASQNNHAHQCFGAAEWTGHFDVDEYPVGAALSGLPDYLRRCGRFTGLVRLDSFWVPRLEGQDVGRRPSVRDFPIRERETRGRAHKYLARNRALVMANTHNGRVRFGYRRRAPRAGELAFLHYKPLTTEWRNYATRGGAERFDPVRHVEDRSVITRMARIESGETSAG